MTFSNREAGEVHDLLVRRGREDLWRKHWGKHGSWDTDMQALKAEVDKLKGGGAVGWFLGWLARAVAVKQLRQRTDTRITGTGKSSSIWRSVVGTILVVLLIRVGWPPVQQIISGWWLRQGISLTVRDRQVLGEREAKVVEPAEVSTTLVAPVEPVDPYCNEAVLAAPWPAIHRGLQAKGLPMWSDQGTTITPKGKEPVQLCTWLTWNVQAVVDTCRSTTVGQAAQQLLAMVQAMCLSPPDLVTAAAKAGVAEGLLPVLALAKTETGQQASLTSLVALYQAKPEPAKTTGGSQPEPTAVAQIEVPAMVEPSYDRESSPSAATVTTGSSGTTSNSVCWTSGEEKLSEVEVRVQAAIWLSQERGVADPTAAAVRGNIDAAVAVAKSQGTCVMNILALGYPLPTVTSTPTPTNAKVPKRVVVPTTVTWKGVPYVMPTSTPRPVPKKPLVLLPTPTPSWTVTCQCQDGWMPPMVCICQNP